MLYILIKEEENDILVESIFSFNQRKQTFFKVSSSIFFIDICPHFNKVYGKSLFVTL